jgi:uncharacterized delta-60 repeat protein
MTRHLLPFLLLFTSLLCLSMTEAHAQAGANDPTFNPTDLGYDYGSGASSVLYTTVLQPDGKILIGGALATYNGTARRCIARLNADGSLDTGFNPGTGALNPVYAIALQPDGKIIIGGSFTLYNGTARNYIARLNADGNIDTGFDPGSGANGYVRAIALQPDGKIIIGGDFTTYNGTGRNYIARLNADGSLDATFNPGSGANDKIQTMALQSDGKTLIGGDFTAYNGTGRNRVARINADGSLDAAFSPGTGTNNTVRAIALQPDGKAVIGGSFTTYNGTGRNFIARVNANGSLDATFNVGTGAGSIVYGITLQPDDKAIIGGFFTTYNGTARNYIARVNANGSLDTGFDPGSGGNNYIQSIALQTDGKAIIVGAFATYNGIARNYITRVNADGTLEATFNQGSGANRTILATALQPDGKIIIGGQFISYNAIGRTRIARLNADGSLDATFDPASGANNDISVIALQPDGKILIGGNFTTYNGTTRNRIARLNADGSLDATFDPGTGANNLVSAITLQSDGKILIGGNLTTYNGITRNRIARLNANGSLDTDFNSATGANNGVTAIVIQSDGKIMIGGNFTTYNGSIRNRIARLNADGTLDTFFNLGTGANNPVNAIALQPDGKIVIGGAFISYNGVSQVRIARLNADGSPDTDFNPSSLGADNLVRTIALQPDEKIIIGGDFTSYNGTGRNRIARLNTNGSLDTGFDPGTGASLIVYAIALQSDGTAIIGGQFVSYNGTGRNRVARILTEDVLPEWTGAVSSEWDNAGNWANNAVPTATDDVTIPDVSGVSGNFPIVNVANAETNGLTVQAGATLTVTSGNALTVNGNLSNSGSVLVAADASGMGSLITQGTITGAGAFQMEQYLKGAGGATPSGVFHYVTSPVAGAAASDYGIASGNKLWAANEVAQNYVQITDGATALNAGHGYVVRMGGSGTVTLSGSAFHTGAVELNSLTRAGAGTNAGYNLIGNPYPSTLSWDAAGKVNMEPSIWYRTHTAGEAMTFDVYNAQSGIGTGNNRFGVDADGLVPPGQGFWVRVAEGQTTGSVTFDNTMRSHGTQAQLYRLAEEEGTVRMRLLGTNGSDEAIIHFSTEAQDGPDAYDSQKMWGAASLAQLYTTAAADTLTINGLFSTETNPVIDLGVKLSGPGSYSLTAHSITLSEEVWLEDRALNQFQYLNENPTYSFATNTGNIGDRFALHFGAMAVGTGRDVACNVCTHVFAADGVVNVSVGNDITTGNITILDMMGRTVQTATINGSRTVVATDPTTGIYLVRVETTHGTETHRVMLR